jgi:hypothetical protein
MQIVANTPEEYIEKLPEAQRQAIIQLRETVVAGLPEGFQEVMSGGMINYVVPFSRYPEGYHCEPKQPLPFLSIAAQKNFIAIYHLGIYAKEDLLQWFVGEYPKHMSTKLDMGKSCIRFKNPEKIPNHLIGDLVGRITVQEWIEIYEQSRAGRK